MFVHDEDLMHDAINAAINDAMLPPPLTLLARLSLPQLLPLLLPLLLARLLLPLLLPLLLLLPLPLLLLPLLLPPPLLSHLHCYRRRHDAVVVQWCAMVC